MSLLSRILFPLVMVFCDRFQGAISTSQEFQTTSNLQDKLNLAEREIIQLRLKQSQSEDMVKIVTAEMKNLLNIRLNMEMTRQRNLAKVPDMRPLCRINQIETTTTTTSAPIYEQHHHHQTYRHHYEDELGGFDHYRDPPGRHRDELDIYY